MVVWQHLSPLSRTASHSRLWENEREPEKEKRSPLSGWRARISNATPRGPLLSTGIPTSMFSCSCTLWLWPQFVSLNRNWKWARHLPLWIYICELALLWEICTCMPPPLAKSKDKISYLQLKSFKQIWAKVKVCTVTENVFKDFASGHDITALETEEQNDKRRYTLFF